MENHNKYRTRSRKDFAVLKAPEANIFSRVASADSIQTALSYSVKESKREHTNSKRYSVQQNLMLVGCIIFTHGG